MTWQNGLQFDAGGNLLVAGNIGTTNFPGAVFDGTTDDSSAIQAVVNLFSNTTRGKITFPPGKTAKINTGLILVSGFVAIDFNGCTLDASGITSGYAVTVIPNGVTPFSLNTPAFPIENLILRGSSSESNVTDGVFIGRLSGSGNVSAQTFRNILIDGFRDGIFIGDQFFINTFIDVCVEDCYRSGLNYNAITNAGESLSWFGGRIANCVKSDGSAVGVSMPNVDAGSNELYLHSVPLDYNDKAFSIAAGTLNLMACHIEGNNQTNTFGDIAWNSGDTPCGVYIVGGTIAPTEATPRAALFSVAGDKAFFIAKCTWSTFNNTAVYITNPSGSPQVDLSGSKPDFTGSTALQVPTIGVPVNRLLNFNFELGNLNGWSSSGTGYTFTADNAAPHSGTWAAKIVSASAANGSLRQYVQCKAGNIVTVSCWVNCTVVSAGTLFVLLDFWQSAPDSTSVTSVLVKTITTIAAPTAGWARFTAYYQVPQGAGYARLALSGSSFTGTAFFDDCEVGIF